MKRDTGRAGLDRQIDNLTSGLREEGAAPGRDLWPEIDQAISRTDQSAAWKNRTAGIGFWRIAAVAASVALVLGLGYVGTTGNHRTANQLTDTAAVTEPAGPSVLEQLDNTLGDLNAAMSEDPENRNLSRLVLLVHKSRASIMKQNSRDWARL